MASLYAEAAGNQGRFWEMHDYLYTTQAIWSGLSKVEDEFDSYALELNLNLDRLHADVESDQVIQKVRNDQRGGNSSGVLSTPAVFVNGRLLRQPTAERITEVVNEEYAASAGLAPRHSPTIFLLHFCRVTQKIAAANSQRTA